MSHLDGEGIGRHAGRYSVLEETNSTLLRGTDCLYRQLSTPLKRTQSSNSPGKVNFTPLHSISQNSTRQTYFNTIHLQQFPPRKMSLIPNNVREFTEANDSFDMVHTHEHGFCSEQDAMSLCGTFGDVSVPTFVLRAGQGEPRSHLPVSPWSPSTTQGRC